MIHGIQYHFMRNGNSLVANGCSRKKIDLDGGTYKQLVIKGYSQVEGVDYNDIFSLVVEMTYIRFFLIAIAYDLKVDQMDVKMTFLHCDLDEDI